MKRKVGERTEVSILRANRLPGETDMQKAGPARGHLVLPGQKATGWSLVKPGIEQQRCREVSQSQLRWDHPAPSMKQVS